MNCPEVREHLTSPRGATLTARALAHAHVTHCAECQAERASLPLALGASSSAPPSPVRLVIAARAARETIRTELTQVLVVSTRLRVLASSSVVVSTRAGTRAIEGTWAGLTWVASQLPILVMLPARAVGGLVDSVRFASVHAARLVRRLGSAAMMACHGAARATGETCGTILGRGSRALGATARGAGRAAVACWLGVLRARDVLVRVGGWVPSLAAPFVRAVGRLVGTIPGLVERAGLAGARSARGLTRLGAMAMVACHGAVRAASAAGGAVLGHVSRFLGESARAAGRMIAGCRPGALRIRDLFVRLGGQAPALAAASTRAVGRLAGTLPGLVEHVRFACARAIRLWLRLGAAAMIACHGAVRVASAAGGAVLGLVSRLLGESARAAGRVIAGCRLGALRIRDLFVRLGERVPAVAAASTRAVVHLVGTVPTGARAHPRVCAGIVGGLVLVSALVFLGPRLRPDDLLSPGEGMLRDARLPVERKPAEPAVATPVVATPVVQAAPPRPAPIPQPVRAPRVAAPEMRAAIPAPVRRSESAAVDATAEASDPSAAIDWLLQGSARRRVETP